MPWTAPADSLTVNGLAARLAAWIPFAAWMTWLGFGGVDKEDLIHPSESGIQGVGLLQVAYNDLNARILESLYF